MYIDITQKEPSIFIVNQSPVFGEMLKKTCKDTMVTRKTKLNLEGSGWKAKDEPSPDKDVAGWKQAFWGGVLPQPLAGLTATPVPQGVSASLDPGP